MARLVVMLIVLMPIAASAMGPTRFGTYSQAYLDRQQAKKWKDLCSGGGRYQAMSEAYDAGKPDPCKEKR